MQRMGLNQRDFRAYQRGLGESHGRRIRVDVQRLNGRTIGPIKAKVIGGQFTGDAKTSPNGVAELVFWDPQRKLSFDPASSERALHRSRRLRIWDDRWIPGLGWVECQQHTGPIYDVDRTGPLVTVVVHDPSTQAQGNAWTERKFTKGRRRSYVAREILADTGEKRIDIPTTKARIPAKLIVLRMDKAWAKAKRVLVGRRLFYTAGRAVARRDPRKPVWRLPRRMVLSNATVDREAVAEPFNTFIVKGGKPKGKNKKTVFSEPAYLPKKHPDSPQNLGRNGVPRRHAQRTENPKIKSKPVANRLAREDRDDAATGATTRTVSVVPYPHGEYGDLVTVPTPFGNERIRQITWSMPYSADGAMELGATRRVGRPLGRPDGGRGGKGRGRGGPGGRGGGRGGRGGGQVRNGGGAGK